GTKLLVTRHADLLGGFARGLEVFTRVELGRILGHEAADRAGHGKANIGVDIDLAHAVLDRFLNLFDRHTIGFLHVATELTDLGKKFLGYAGAAVHHQMGVGQAGVDFLDALDRQNVARGLASELVGAVAGTYGNRQGIELRAT